MSVWQSLEPLVMLGPLSAKANSCFCQHPICWLSGKPPSYLDRILKVAIAYLLEQQPTPLSPEVFSAIQRELSVRQTLKQMEVGQNLSDSKPLAGSQNVQKSYGLDQRLMEQSERAISQAAEIMLEMVGVSV